MHFVDEMLKEIGITSIDELFVDIPASLKKEAPKIDDGMSEFEVVQTLKKIAKKNVCHEFSSFLGAGAYEHHIPAIVQAITQKSEFLTSYTPYQPEISQGMLQIIFEFQSAVCALTGMEVANASLYDGACASAEALLMALRLQKNKKKVVVASTLHPHYREVIKTYLGHSFSVVFGQEVDEETAAVLIQTPNFLGEIEDGKKIGEKAKQKGALFIVCGNPLSFGLFKTPGEMGADIAVGDMQPFGMGLQFGGPYCGYMATKKEFVRQMPGRIVGETVDTEGRRGFVLTLQAREQHIRREKATSNICSNQALAALAALVTLLWYGQEGIRALALTCYRRACYLREQLQRVSRVKIVTTGEIFNEFAVQFDTASRQVQEHFEKRNILPGYPIDDSGQFLVAVTEIKSKKDLDDYVHAAKSL